MEPTRPITGTHRSGRRQRWGLAAVVGLLVITASCNGNDDEGVAVGDQEEWCDAVAEVDLLFAEGEINSDDFDLARRAAEDIGERLTELRAGVDQLDPDVRTSVNAEIDFGLAFTTAFVEADDYESAMVELQRLSSGDASDGAVGRAWVLDNCGVDMTD